MSTLSIIGKLTSSAKKFLYCSGGGAVEYPERNEIIYNPINDNGTMYIRMNCSITHIVGTMSTGIKVMNHLDEKQNTHVCNFFKCVDLKDEDQSLLFCFFQKTSNLNSVDSIEYAFKVSKIADNVTPCEFTFYRDDTLPADLKEIAAAAIPSLNAYKGIDNNRSGIILNLSSNPTNHNYMYRITFSSTGVTVNTTPLTEATDGTNVASSGDMGTTAYFDETKIFLIEPEVDFSGISEQLREIVTEMQALEQQILTASKYFITR